MRSSHVALAKKGRRILFLSSLLLRGVSNSEVRSLDTIAVILESTSHKWLRVAISGRRKPLD